jgi:hypothetical protein
MTIEVWWPKLPAQTRGWLIANNGDTVPEEVVAEIAAVGGPAGSDPWWSAGEGSAGRSMPDEAIDWIEEIANDDGGDD